jgi:hypothetical protein
MDSRFRGKDEEREITRNESHSGTENGPPEADKLFDQSRQNSPPEADKLFDQSRQNGPPEADRLFDR